MALLALFFILTNAASAGEAYCDACSGDSGWTGAAKLDEIGNPNAGKSEVMPGLSTAQKNRVGIWNKPLAGLEEDNAIENTDNSAQNKDNSKEKLVQNTAKSTPVEENVTVVRSTNAKKMLIPIEDVSDSDVLLDISANATEHIQGSIAIPYSEFLINGSLKPVEEISEILGEAGISHEDSIDIYGECMSCGGGPAPAAFIYWIMKSLGHENVRMLDGNVEDWAKAGKPVTGELTKAARKTYIAVINQDFTATYDYVKNGSAQIVDARTIQEFGANSIPGSINIPYTSVIIDNKIGDETRLAKVFAILNKNQPVVVYTNTGIKGSVVWFSLMLQGYDAKLYSYQNYLINQVVSNQAISGNDTN